MFCAGAMLTCLIINSNIFGNLAMLVSAMSKKTTEFSEKLDTVNTAMKNMNMPDETVNKVQDFIMSTQGTLDHQKEMESFLELISPSLRLEVTRHIFSEIVIQNPIFSGDEKLIDYLVKYLITCLYLPEDIIITQGDIADDLYFLARGEVQIFIIDQNNDEKYVNTLKLGA